MIGRTLSRYRIVGLLGEGGMGTVYLADDPSRKRQVAAKSDQSKFLPLGSILLEMRIVKPHISYCSVRF